MALNNGATHWPGHAWRMGCIAALVAAVIVPHFMMPPGSANVAWHEIHRHLLYIPILLTALWYGGRGGLIVALVVSALYFPHLLMHEHMHHAEGAQGLWRVGAPTTYLLAAFTYFLAGGGVGYLFSRLRGANARLEQQSVQLRDAMERLTEQTREVFAAEEQLRRADRLAALGHLTSGLAHELRNPLASIRGAAEILGDAGVPEARRAEFSQVLVEETQRLDHVLGEFLDYARVKQSEEPHAAVLAAVLGRVLKLLESQFAKNRVAVSVTVPADLPRLRISEALLQQVLLNLLLNATQAMPQGGEVAIAAQAGEEPTTEAERVEIRIRDNGPGVPAEIAGQIFNPFFTTRPQGTGLGLSIVHKIVTGQGGTLHYEPAMPRGAVFVLKLAAWI
jgi:signal transduction histidine kinase